MLTIHDPDIEGLDVLNDFEGFATKDYLKLTNRMLRDRWPGYQGIKRISMPLFQHIIREILYDLGELKPLVFPASGRKIKEDRIRIFEACKSIDTPYWGWSQGDVMTAADVKSSTLSLCFPMSHLLHQLHVYHLTKEPLQCVTAGEDGVLEWFRRQEWFEASRLGDRPRECEQCGAGTTRLIRYRKQWVCGDCLTPEYYCIVSTTDKITRNYKKVEDICAKRLQDCV